MQLITVALKPRKLHVRPNPSIDAYFRKRHVFQTKELKNQARKGGTHATVYFRKYPTPRSKVKTYHVGRLETSWLKLLFSLKADCARERAKKTPGVIKLPSPLIEQKEAVDATSKSFL